jgi:hypothetical protein
MPGAYAQVDSFVRQHRPHGVLSAGMGDAAAHGYPLRLVCPCGDSLALWIAEADAEHDLLRSGLLAGEN